MEYGDGALMVKMGEAFIVLCPDPTLSQGEKGSGDLRPIPRASLS